MTEKNNDSIDKNKENSSSKEAPPAFDSNTLPVIDLHNYKITHVNGIEAFKAVKSLDLSFNKIESVSGFEGLLHLRELKLYNNKISSLSGLARLSTLNNFEIHNNYINSISVRLDRKYTMRGIVAVIFDDYQMGLKMTDFIPVEFTLVDFTLSKVKFSSVIFFFFTSFHVMLHIN